MSTIIKAQEFKVFNTTNQRLMFRGLIVPSKGMATTYDSDLFLEPDVDQAMRDNVIQVVPNPRDFYAASSGTPLATEYDGGGSGGSTGDGNILRVARNDDSATMIRGSPAQSIGPGAVRGAIGNPTGRNVYGLCATASDLPSGASGDFLVDGTLLATTAEWEAVTGMVGGLVRGSKYYLDVFQPGLLKININMATAPSPSYLVCVGYALSPVEFKLEIQPSIRIA